MKTITKKSSQDKFQTLLEWKKLYMDALIDALNPTGNVLEIGFGMGISANHIQTFFPKTHTIIESNPQILQEALKWADKKPNTTIIQGKWETVLPNLPKFDVIFFHDYPIEYDIGTLNFLFPKDTIQTPEKAKELLNSLEEEMAQMTMKFSDQDIDDFYKKIGKFDLMELPKFFKILKKRGNVSKAQYDKLIKKYHVVEAKEEETAKDQNLDQDESHDQDNMISFLEKCLEKHMHKGSRFSCYLNNSNSKYQDRNFEKIIANPHLNYKESLMPLAVGDKKQDALIILIEKKS